MQKSIEKIKSNGNKNALYVDRKTMTIRWYLMIILIKKSL